MIEFIGAISEEDLAKADKETIGMIKSYALVRCKDCKYADDGVCQNSIGLVIQDDDDFCSRAERRTDETD